MELQEWITALPGSPTVSQAADHAGVSKATFLRHAKKGETTAEYAVAISRAYDVNEVETLVSLGFITAEAVDDYGVVQALERATNRQILDEIMRRSDPEARQLFGADEDTIGLADDAEVFELPNRNVRPVSDDEVPFDAVADSSPEEGDGDPGSYEP